MKALMSELSLDNTLNRLNILWGIFGYTDEELEKVGFQYISFNFGKYLQFIKVGREGVRTLLSFPYQVISLGYEMYIDYQ